MPQKLLRKKKPELNREFLKKEYFFPKGRAAWLWTLKLLKLNKKNKILLPSYIGISDREGSGVFDPIRKLRVGYEFYKLNPDLSVNLEDLNKKIKQPKVKAVLIIHYFGFCQKGFGRVLKICQDNKKYLIEDAAHAFNSFYRNKRLGRYGDISFYSIHKFLPVDSGGMLFINNNNIEIAKEPKDDISHQALIVLKKSDIAKTSKAIRDNYQYWLRKIKKVKGLQVFYKELPQGITPLNFPILIEKKDRNEVYFKLQDRGIEVVSLYYRIISKIKKQEYPLSHDISKRILNLPAHQDITKKDIDFILKELKNILEDERT